MQEAVAGVKDGIRRINGQFIAQEASKSAAEGERAQHRVAKLQKLVQASLPTADSELFMSPLPDP